MTPGRSLLARVALVIAVIWLIVSVAAGAWLIKTAGTDDQVMSPAKAPRLSATSALSAYGGDAYTGIQNAAADTEHSVVNGFNSLAAYQQALAQAKADSDLATSERLQQALGLLIIGLGVLTFVVAASHGRRAT
jgi:hypothetical protein